jgi:hypothetical protein
MQFVVKYPNAAVGQRAPFGALELALAAEAARARSKVSSLPLPRGRRGLTFERQDTEVGGADRDRTDDPLLAKQVLSQLSYSPRTAAL